MYSAIKQEQLVEKMVKKPFKLKYSIKMNPAMVKVQSFGNTLVQSYNYVHSKILHIEQACVYEVCKNLKKYV